MKDAARLILAGLTMWAVLLCGIFLFAWVGRKLVDNAVHHAIEDATKGMSDTIKNMPRYEAPKRPCDCADPSHAQPVQDRFDPAPPRQSSEPPISP